MSIQRRYKGWEFSMTYEAYVKNKTYIGYGLINGIINAAIFYFSNMSKMGESVTFHDATVGMAINSVLLGMILTWCVVPLTKQDIKNDKFEANKHFTQAQKLPQGAIALSVVLGIVCGVVGTAISALLFLIFQSYLTNWTVMIVKCVVCAVVGGLAGFTVIEDVVAHKLED